MSFTYTDLYAYAEATGTTVSEDVESNLALAMAELGVFEALEIDVCAALPQDGGPPP